jgi:uncharacterized protein
MDIRTAILSGQPVPCEVIDAHTHLTPFHGRGWYQYKPAMADTIRCLDRYGIDTVVTSLHVFAAGYQDLANETTRRLIADYPGRVWGYVTVNPGWDVKRAEQEVAACADAEGFAGFKLHPGWQPPMFAPAYECVWAAANARRAPVLCHTWCGDPPTRDFEKALKKYPDVPLLVGHCGGSREAYLDFIALSKDYPNCCLEICGSLACDLWLEDIVAAAGADRVFFGTDMINCEGRLEIGRVGLADLPESAKAMIFAGNFRRLLANRRPPAKLTDRTPGKAPRE